MKTNKIAKAQVKTETLPTWDLSFLYKGVKDKKIDSDFQQALNLAVAFKKKFRGKMKADAKIIRSAINSYEQIFLLGLKPYTFAGLLNAENGVNPEHGKLLQKCQEIFNHIEQHTIFFELQLAELTDKEFTMLEKSPELSKYKNYLTKIRLQKRHRLTESEEKILSVKQRTSRSAFVRLYDKEFAAKLFTLGSGKKERKVSESEVLSYMHNPVRETRKQAAASLTQGLKEDSQRLTFITNTLAEDKIIEDSLRKYDSPEHSRHLSNEVTQPMVDALSGAVQSFYPLVQKFYKWKEKKLQFQPLYDYDRYAPILTTESSYSYEEGKRIVLESLNKFDPQIGKIASNFFTEKRVDAAKREGKRGGAFCSYVSKDLQPVVFINYTGNLRDVFTLAHELGHGIHGTLMQPQPVLNFETPLPLAETASVFAEMLLFNELKDAVQPGPEKEALYVLKIESIFATVFRQISMYKFEQDLHNARIQNGELAVSDINKLWRKTQTEMFGKSVTLTPDYDYWWSYIPHFIHTPFYVYAYAFGELLTISLFAQFQKNKEKFIPAFKTLLSSGCEKSPAELLKPFGVKLDDREFWIGGLKVIESMVNELIGKGLASKSKTKAKK